MKFRSALSTTASLFGLLLVPSLASAQSFGFIGGSIDYGYGLNSTDNDEFFAFAPQIEAGYVFSLQNGASIVVDAMLRMDNYDPDLLDDEVPLLQYQVGAQYLQPISDRLILGGFAGYGIASFEDDDEVYQVGFIGGSVSYAATDMITIFGQAGYGTSFDEAAMSSAGFYNGYMVRAGVVYTGFEKITLRAEAEYAATESYEDNNEPGEMFTIALLGEYQIGSNDNLVMTFGARFGQFDALVDPDLAQETSVQLGVRYTFGGGTSADLMERGYYGSPYLPLRSSFWTPTQD